MKKFSRSLESRRKKWLWWWWGYLRIETIGVAIEDYVHTAAAGGGDDRVLVAKVDAYHTHLCLGFTATLRRSYALSLLLLEISTHTRKVCARRGHSSAATRRGAPHSYLLRIRASRISHSRTLAPRARVVPRHHLLSS